MASKTFKLSELMAEYTPSDDYVGWLTNDDWVFAIGIEGIEGEVENFEVVQMGIAGLDAQMNSVTQDKQYIRAGQSTTKTGTQRTFVVTGDRYIGDGAQDFIFSHKIKYGTGNDVIVPYVYFNVKDGKGEKGTVSIVVNSDSSGNAGESSSISVDFRKVGPTPVEYKYTAGMGG